MIIESANTLADMLPEENQPTASVSQSQFYKWAIEKEKDVIFVLVISIGKEKYVAMNAIKIVVMSIASRFVNMCVTWVLYF